MKKPPKACLGYPVEGSCQNPAGSTHSKHWCQSCDELRRAAITAKLEALLAKYEGRG